eukprot:5008842-Amphidinium_carterae.1
MDAGRVTWKSRFFVKIQPRDTWQTGRVDMDVIRLSGTYILALRDCTTLPSSSCVRYLPSVLSVERVDACVTAAA